MKAHLHWLFILVLSLISCGQKSGRVQENKLERHFEKCVVRKQHVRRTEHASGFDKNTTSYFIGYDSLNRIVNSKNNEFYEYDSLGRISKRYQCVLERDPTCSKPLIFYYEYANGNLARIRLLNKFLNDSLLSVYETFLYDDQNRLVRQTKTSTDTLLYTYIGNDTCKHWELETFWTNDVYGKWVKVSKRTTFQYDSLGRKTSLTWNSPNNGTSGRNEFFYDSNNRLIMEKDTSLDNFAREPNSCCILYRTNYKYDDEGRLIEEERSTGSYDDPSLQLQRSTKYQY